MLLRKMAFYLKHSKKNYEVIADKKCTQTGSFNYSQVGATRNSENMLEVCDELVAGEYLKHWQSRWDKGIDWKSEY